MEDFTKCPYCGGEELPNAEQPYPSLHARTLLYKCGTEIIIINNVKTGEFEKVKRCNED